MLIALAIVIALFVVFGLANPYFCQILAKEEDRQSARIAEREALANSKH